MDRWNSLKVKEGKVCTLLPMFYSLSFTCSTLLSVIISVSFSKRVLERTTLGNSWASSRGRVNSKYSPSLYRAWFIALSRHFCGPTEARFLEEKLIGGDSKHVRAVSQEKEIISLKQVILLSLLQ